MHDRHTFARGLMYPFGTRAAGAADAAPIVLRLFV
jgi:hypothetical protein